jgi:hypothetical protein
VHGIVVLADLSIDVPRHDGALYYSFQEARPQVLLQAIRSQVPG